jgi:hypothetical protein
MYSRMSPLCKGHKETRGYVHPLVPNWSTKVEMLEAALYRKNTILESSLHPIVYKALAGVVVWIVAVALLFFGHDRSLLLLLAVISFLCVAVIMLPFCLWLIWRKHHPARVTTTFSDWSSHEIETASGLVDGGHAAIMVLLAPSAVALGITATALVAYIVN